MEKTRRSRWKRWGALLLVIVLLGGYGTWAVKRPLPVIQPDQAVTVSGTSVPPGNLTWPTPAEAAVGLLDTGTLETHGNQTPLPTASTAKLITALSVLHKKSLQPGQQGPTITLTDNDVAIYNAYKAQDGSVMKVIAGEQITEYQMLQAVMLPSANNIADSLAIWAFGSLQAYNTYANNYVGQLGLTSTHVGTDASGFSPTTVSTARDLVKLGEAAMHDKVLAGIVNQPTANGLPVVGTVKNVNFLLGSDGIVGIKTGNTDEAGGVFVGASQGIINDKQITVVTAVIGSQSLLSAMKDSLDLIRSAQANFKPVTVVKAGMVAGRYNVPWGGTIQAVATKDIRLSGWAGGSVPYTVQLRGVPADSTAGDPAGNVTVKQSGINNTTSVSVRLQSGITAPSVWWRLLHPLD